MERENKKINLLVDGHFLSGLRQGTRTHIIGLYNAFIEQFGNQYNVFVSGHNRDDVLNFLNIPHENFLQFKSESNFGRLLFELPFFISKYKIQFAHFQQIAPLYKNCNFITTVHDVLFNDYPEKFSDFFRISRNFLFKQSIKKSEIKLTVSNYSRSRISEYFHIPETEISVTFNGVSDKYFQEYSKETVNETLRNNYNLSRYALFVSRLEPRKNHETLIRAYKHSKLPDEKVGLIFVGNRTANNEGLDQALDELPGRISQYVQLYEDLDDDELLNFYRGAEMFVYPSLAEGFGIPPLEAAACKIPVLCSNKTAMTDFKKLGFTMFDPEDENQLVECLNENLFQSPSQDKLESARDLIKNNYSWHKSAEILHWQIRKVSKKSCLTKN